MTLLSAPRKVGARVIGFRVFEGMFLRGPRSAYVVLDVMPADPRRSKFRYNRRLTIGRIAEIPAGTRRDRIIDWVWDHSRKRAAA